MTEAIFETTLTEKENARVFTKKELQISVILFIEQYYCHTITYCHKLRKSKICILGNTIKHVKLIENMK